MMAALPETVTIEQLRAAIAQKKRELAEASLRAFVEQAWSVLEPSTPFVPGIHVDAICEHLQAVSDARIRNLIANVPPGHAKSLTAAVFWPAWDWIKHPERRWIFSSYRSDLALRDSVKCRTLIDSNWYQENWPNRVVFKADQNQKSRYENAATGYRVIATIGAGTGERGDMVVVDDPTSADEAESDAKRKAANDWWTGSMSSRLNNPKTGHFVIIQQRLHQEDLTGHMLEKKADYEHLFLPEEFEPERACKTSIWKDPRTKPGELLWPQMRGPEQVAESKTTMGTYRYAGQYQQRPSPSGGGIFKRFWWRYWKPKYMELPPVTVELPDKTQQRIRPIDLPDDFDEMLQSWDCAFKDLRDSDYVAGGLWGSKGASRFLIDQRRERMDLPATMNAIRAMTRKYPKATLKLIEDKANGPAVIQMMRREIQGLLGVNPEGGKIARANAVSPQVEAGNVFLPHPTIAPWVDAFIEELATFPNARNDDQVDQTTQALIRMQTRSPQFPPPAPRRPTGDRSWMA